MSLKYLFYYLVSVLLFETFFSMQRTYKLYLSVRLCEKTVSVIGSQINYRKDEDEFSDLDI